jgi:hypothetical protein
VSSFTGRFGGSKITVVLAIYKYQNQTEHLSPRLDFSGFTTPLKRKHMLDSKKDESLGMKRTRTKECDNVSHRRLPQVRKTSANPSN